MIKILFVCLGNICRSPSAEAVFTKMVKDAKLSDKFTIDSAGTYGGHSGEPADSRMQKHAIKRGYNLTSKSRQINSSDFTKFDMIIGMDHENIRDINRVKPRSGTAKIIKMTDLCTKVKADEVPDPYYGGARGFEMVLDILEDGCSSLLEKSKAIL
jgi:protein-tyrosine phosphatase